MLLPEYHTSPLLAPFVFWLKPNCWEESVISGTERNGKPFHLLSQKDYDALINPDKLFIDDNMIEGDAHAYEGDACYWYRSSDLNGAREVEYQYYPISWNEVNSLRRALKFIFARGAYVSSERFEIIDNPESTLALEKEKGLVKSPKSNRRVKAINIVR
jgi:hypothetical protein